MDLKFAAKYLKRKSNNNSGERPEGRPRAHEEPGDGGWGLVVCESNFGHTIFTGRNGFIGT